MRYRAGDRGYAPGMPTLVLLRHGQSLWNAENLFTGWYDVDLSAQGEDEARAAGALLAAEAGLDLRVVHTSLLTRAVRTAELALGAAGRSWLPVRRHWRLNERHYGALQGLDKKETTARHGEAQVKEWRRSYATPPPAVGRGDAHDPAGDPRYRDIPADALPLTECLADVVARVVPYWGDAVVPDLLAEGPRGGAVLVRMWSDVGSSDSVGSPFGSRKRRSTASRTNCARPAGSCPTDVSDRYERRARSLSS